MNTTSGLREKVYVSVIECLIEYLLISLLQQHFALCPRIYKQNLFP